MRIPKNGVQRFVLSIRPRYDSVIAAGEGHALYWTSLTQVNRERDIHSPVINLSFLKMTPCLKTGEQHDCTDFSKTFTVLMQN